MQPEVALERLGGVASARVLLQVTTRARLRRALAQGLVVRDARGRFALPGADAALRAAHRLNGVLVEDSAAHCHGWELKHVPRSPTVAVPRTRKVTLAQRTDVRVRYVDLSPEDVSGRLVRVGQTALGTGPFLTVPGATVMGCASRLPFDEALAVADSALRHGDVGPRELVARAEAMPARYRARCLRVATHADGRAANPFESVLRSIALDVPGLDVEPQVWIDDVGRPDLLDQRLRLVVEADSFEFHGRRRALVHDCERYNAFVLRGWRVVRFSWEHVMLEPDYVRDVLIDLVGQPPAPALVPVRALSSA